MTVTKLSAAEILDSRGIPTLEVDITVEGLCASASVPAGKSTGANEARERRDGDPLRYNGRGVHSAVDSVEREIAPALIGHPLPGQDALDEMLCALDGTPRKERLGANAILGVSLAAARARAGMQQLPLYDSLFGQREMLLPVPCFNVVNGGAHADNALVFQEFMIVPAGRASFAEALRAGAETYHALATILDESSPSAAVGDEGGFAPAIERPTDALDLLMRAIERAGYHAGDDIWIALDPAANGFYQGGRYEFNGESRDAAAMTEMYASWLDRYPIVSIEDGLAENDLDGWQLLTRTLGSRVQLVGDDLFVSDPARIQAGITDDLATAVLLKPNQIGTLTEITTAARVAQAGGFTCMVSHRSGETNDSFIADLAVALGAGQLKAGAPARGERVAKYNRLLRIERELAERGRYAGLTAFRLNDRMRDERPRPHRPALTKIGPAS